MALYLWSVMKGGQKEEALLTGKLTLLAFKTEQLRGSLV